MFMLAKGRLEWHPSIRSTGAHKAFPIYFGRQQRVCGDILRRAPIDIVSHHIEALATKRGFPATGARGRAWKTKQAICPGVRARIFAHEEAARIGHGKVPTLIANIAQNVPFSSPLTELAVPALLRSSSLWSMRFQRFLTPLKRVEIQGYNIFGLEPKCPFRRPLD